MNKLIFLFIIFILIIIFLLCRNNKIEKFKVDENVLIYPTYYKKDMDLVENINIVNNNKNIFIIPKYISNNEVKLLILNFNNVINNNIKIKINEKPYTLKNSNKYAEIILKNNDYSFNVKKEKKCKIPKIIMQTSKNMNVSINKFLSIRTIIDNNPNYEYNFFDNERSKEFIKKYYNKEVLDAYNKLIPGAYKADLFRYCYLYINGGVYIDCKMICHINFDDLLNDYDIILIKDIGPRAYWNGFICAKPRLELFKKCINNIVENVKKEYYGYCSLDITGPTLFYNNINLNSLKYKILDFDHIKHGHPENCMRDNGKKILNTSYPTYYEENDYKQKDHYGKYWSERKVYATIS